MEHSCSPRQTTGFPITTQSLSLIVRIYTRLATAGQLFSDRKYTHKFAHENTSSSTRKYTTKLTPNGH